MDLIKAQTIANQLMVKHGIAQQGWRFKFDTTRRRFGCCKFRLKTITMSKYLTELNEESIVVNTILHEIAHALTPGHGHDYVWVAKAREIGCTGDRCYNPQTVKTPESKYVAVCPTCGHTHKKHKMRRYVESSCGYCSNGRYNPTHKLVFVLNPNF